VTGLEKTVELVPRGPRVVGPGRRERAYLEQLDALRRRLARTAERAHHVERELDTSQRLERGCQRLIDRMENGWSQDRERLDAAQAQQKRLILAMGALQKENELLQRKLELAAAEPARLAAENSRASRRKAPPQGLIARLFGKRSRRRTRSGA